MHDMSDTRPARRAVRETSSFRFPPDLIERLDDRAGRLGVTRTTLAQRLLDEGIRMVEHPGIAFTSGAEGERRATLAGTRLDVSFVVEALRANRGRSAAVADLLEIPLALVDAAARYYAAWPAEIDREIALAEEIAAREATLQAEQRRLLG